MSFRTRAAQLADLAKFLTNGPVSGPPSPRRRPTRLFRRVAPRVTVVTYVTTVAPTRVQVSVGTPDPAAGHAVDRPRHRLPGSAHRRTEGEAEWRGTYPPSSGRSGPWPSDSAYWAWRRSPSSPSAAGLSGRPSWRRWARCGC